MQTVLILSALLLGSAAAADPTPSGAPAVDVTRFGARPNDDRDDTAALVAAVREVQTNGAHRLVFPPGSYRLTSGGNPQNPHILFAFRNIAGLHIDGAGAELLVSGATCLFHFDSCRNVSVQGLTIDWPRPPFSVGTVTATAPRHFDVAVEPQYPVSGGEPVGAFMDYDPSTRLPQGRDLDVYGAVERTELLGPQLLRVRLNRELAVPVGKLLVLRHQVYGFNAFTFSRCTDVQVRDTTLYTTPGMGLVATVCENVTLRNFNVCKRPGTRRPMSATADAAHFGGCKGTVTLEDCTFEGMGDDGANVKSGLYLSVRRRLDEHTVIGQHNLKMTDLPDPGDTLELSHPETLLPFASGRVRSASLEPGDGRLHRITFEAPLPPELREGDVLGNASRTPALRMRHCTVRDNRARGVLCQTRDALIENCLFQNCTSAGVLVLTEIVYFFESIGTRKVTVRNNRFENCNCGAAPAEAALCAVAYLKAFAYPPRPGVHRDVRFEGNSFLGTDEGAVFAVGTDGLTLLGNVVEDACRRGTRPNGRCALRVQDCARVVADGNMADPARQGPRFSTPVLVTPPATTAERLPAAVQSDAARH